MKRLVALALLALGLSAAAPGPGTDMEVPVARQVPLLARVLAFDRSLEGSGPLVVAVVSQPNNRSSSRVGSAFARVLADRGATVHGRPVRAVRVQASTAAEVRSGLRRVGADVAYISPLRSVSVREIARTAAREDVLSLTGVRAYVDAGVAVGVGLRAGRPEILLNQRAASRSGADFSARLLQLATLVGS